MRVNEIFFSIQGEGRYQGYPMLFIRLAGCNLNCSFCDTNYHLSFTIPKTQIRDMILSSRIADIVFTGGEPLLQLDEILEVVTEAKKTNPNIRFHLETNGELAVPEHFFWHVCFSPKTERGLEHALEYGQAKDIKIVYGVYDRFLEHATSILPLTTFYGEQDLKVLQQAWNYAVRYKKHLSFRGHIWAKQK